MSLNNRIAIITGATGGLGRTVAKELAAKGASLALFSSNKDKLSQLEIELDLPRERWLTRAIDFREQGAAQTAVRLTNERFGRADILVHLIGGWTGGRSMVDFEITPYEQMLQQHFWTSLYLFKALVPQFVDHQWGRVIVVSSPVAARPTAKSSPYAAAKAAQEALVMSLANEIKHTGVTANVIRVKTIDVEYQKERNPSDKNVSWTTPEEITQTILYLCSEDANMVNGAQIPLYGSP